VPIGIAGMTCTVMVTVAAALFALPWGAMLALVLGAGWPYISANLAVSLIGTAAGVAVGVLLSLNRRWSLQLLEELAKARSLGGMLNMCPACCRVALGGAEWMPLEEFLKNHSLTTIDHHVCPGCSSRLGGGALAPEAEETGGTSGEFREGNVPEPAEDRECLPLLWRTVLLILAVLVYLLSFRLIHITLGYGANITALIPVTAVAWFFPPLVTVFAGLITFPANILMSLWMGAGWERIGDRLIVSIAGTLTVVLVGGLISRGRTILRHLKSTRRRVKVLSGLLPVCPFCRRVLGGDGNWLGMEEFMHRHSGTDFIHSLCPECADRLGAGEKSRDWNR